jgi:hypothetical protein
MNPVLLLGFLLLSPADDLPIASDAPAAYRQAMERGKEALNKKKYADAAREFGEALRQKKGDKSAEKGFGQAIRELEIYNTRYGDLKTETIAKFGMNKAVEPIQKGLKWLASQQQEDGRWKCKPMAGATDDMASTAFALLAFLADGNSEATGPYKDTVAKGVGFLLKQQRPDGSFGGARHYTEGLCVLALVEAFVMGGTDTEYEAAQKGVSYVVKVQRPEGGWLYGGTDNAGPGDTSVTGMMFQPLKQGQMAYLDFDPKALLLGRDFIDLMTAADGYVGYRGRGDRAGLALTAIGNLVRIYSGVSPDDQKVKPGLALVLQNKEQMKANIYFLYYGVMIAFLAGGDSWQSWSSMMLPFLIEKQVKEGPEAGSWAPEGKGVGAGFADYLSQTDSTAMSLLALECCYRYVPANMLKRGPGPAGSK